MSQSKTKVGMGVGGWLHACVGAHVKHMRYGGERF